MAGTGVYVTVDGQKQLLSVLNGISSSGKNLKPALDKAAEIVISTIKDNFRSNGARLNKPWQPRTRSYSWPILNKTGKLKGAFRHTSSAKQATISNPTEYFPYHQLGTRRGLPARKMLGITYEDSAKIAQILANYLMKGASDG